MRTLRFAALAIPVMLATAGAARGESDVGLLVAHSSADQWGAEARAACNLGKQLTAATVIVPAAKGKFVDESGAEVSLDRFRVVWYHQGDSVDTPGPIYDAKTIEALRGYVDSGHGLLLSGAALALTNTLGVEPLNPRRGGPGNDRSTAALVPVQREHPIFAGLRFDGGAARISNTGHPAFADFHASGGPTGGMLLARTPSGSENPLVEYELGKGRIIAMGWRLPHYSNAENDSRDNLERLTKNILAYLGDRKQWQKVVVKPFNRPSRRVPGKGVPAEEWRALKLAVSDLSETFAEHYPQGARHLKDLETLRQAHDELQGEGDTPNADRAARLEELAKKFDQLRSEALLANPLVDFDRLLLVKRGNSSPRLGMPANWQGNCSLPRTGFNDEIATLSLASDKGELTTLHKPDGGRFVGDLDLHFDGERLLFSSVGSNETWQVFEINVDGSGLHQVTPSDDQDVDNYDACYLPSGDMIFSSTDCFQGVPCVKGSAHVANLYAMDARGQNIRQLTFDQDHDWCPTVLANGRVLYLRWEYSDLPHFVSRILFHMNPDGTEQFEYYGSNSYWPNSAFYARPVPGHATKFVAVISGHHDVARIGELVLFDTAKGRHEADGAVQRIPGYGKTVEPILRDGLVRDSWPKFLHPWPLSDKYFIVSAQPTAQSVWGIYLADVFDNMILIKETPGYALLEPVPLRPTKKPHVIPSRVQPKRDDAVVHMADVYAGPGLAGIPRGTVKKLRLFTYHFAYHGMGGQINRVGLDGPWDVKRIVGTVPVESDGSALFRIPANTPISVQPLDAEGKSLQLMRSWFVGMPGEHVSCIGCHERRNTAPPQRASIALDKPPSEIVPWYGPTRGFSFKREVQPVLDQHCVGCHAGDAGPDGQFVPNFRRQPDVNTTAGSNAYNHGTQFSPSYLALRRFVRSPTIESDMHLLSPMDFHADTTRLIQLLRKGHYEVKLDAEDWDRLVTWIDLHTPAHGTWHEIVGEKLVSHQRERRRAMMMRYAGRDEDPEAIYEPEVSAKRPPVSASLDISSAAGVSPSTSEKISLPGWPFDADEAKRRQEAGVNSRQTIDLGDGTELELAFVPAGQFVMGDTNGHSDEQPLRTVRIDKSFWIGRFEVTNRQFRQFDSTHNSRLEHGDFLQFSHQERGYSLNQPDQPVVRVSWSEAMAFCRWLTDKTGKTFTLPTEQQWEYACRAGTGTPLSYGGADDDFSAQANLADVNLERVDNFEPWSLPVGAIHAWRPSDARFNDRFRVSAPVGSYAPNAWGLHDMHGNVAEWTSSQYRSNLFASNDGRRVVRGGSWYDRAKDARSASRVDYWPYQRVYDVGFRVTCAIENDARE